MKATILKSIVFVATTALTLSSCEKEIRNAASVEEVKITVKATADDLGNVADTKTYINSDKQILWGENEQMTIAVIAGENQSIADSDAISDFDGESQAMFTFSITPGEAEQYTYCGMYPAAAKADNNIDATKFKVILPDTQSATGSSYDPKAYILISRPEVFNTVQTDWIASYRRATALNKITLTGLSEDIVSVEITVPEGIDLAGRRYFNLTTGHSGDVYFGKTNSVKVNYVSALTGTSKDVWFTSWESNIPAGGKLTIKATSTAHTYTRTITARESGISFHEGNLNLLSVNMAADDVEIEDITTLSGNFIIASFGYNTNSQPIGTWATMTGTIGGSSTKPYYTYNPTTVPASNEVDLTSSDINFGGINDYWIIEKNGDNYAIKNASTGKYISFPGSGNFASASDSPYALTITADDSEEGRYVISSVSDVTRKLQYNCNSGQERFAFYLDTQWNVFLIPYVPAEQYAVSILSTISNGSVTANKEMACAGETVTLTATPADNYKLQAWDVKDADNNTITVTDNSFIMPAKSVTVGATFEAKTYYTITVGSVTNGTVTPSKTQAEAGETITVDVVPSTGYKLATLTYNGNDIKNAMSFVMPAENVTIAATFEEKSEDDDPILLETTLSNSDIVSWGTAATGYNTWSGSDENGFEYSAYAVKNKHSNATSSYHFLQIKKYASETASYIKLPEFPGYISSITLTVSNASNPMTGGGNSSTLFFSSNNNTTSTGTGVASGTGSSSVTIDASSLNLKTGYITANGSVRIWDIAIEYYSK